MDVSGDNFHRLCLGSQYCLRRKCGGKGSDRCRHISRPVGAGKASRVVSGLRPATDARPRAMSVVPAGMRVSGEGVHASPGPGAADGVVPAVRGKHPRRSATSSGRPDRRRHIDRLGNRHHAACNGVVERDGLIERRSNRACLFSSASCYPLAHSTLTTAGAVDVR